MRYIDTFESVIGKVHEMSTNYFDETIPVTDMLFHSIKRMWFDIPKRYYQRNKEMVEACDLLHAFISAEDGFIGGTRFEVEYAVSLGIPVQLPRGNSLAQWIFQYSFPFLEAKQAFFLAWKAFFHKIRFELGGTR